MNVHGRQPAMRDPLIVLPLGRSGAKRDNREIETLSFQTEVITRMM
jgi:hypothetical protein